MTEVSILDLKAKADKFPEPVRSDILHEPDSMDVERYLVKMETWSRMLKMEVQRK